MVVVVDATGSMTSPHSDGMGGTTTRFEVARGAAADRVLNASMEVGGLSGVAVYTFSGSGTTQWTMGGVGPNGAFVSPSTAYAIITGSIAVTPFVTPLADALCETGHTASLSGTGSTTVRFLEFYTDGEENASFGACSGPFSVSSTAPYDLGSWQNKVYVNLTGQSPAVTFNPTLYTLISGPIAPPPAPFAPTRNATVANADTAATASRAAARTGFAAVSAFLSDADFLADLAAATGGNFTIVDDNSPPPVFGDLDGDFDVDRNDAIILARAFGQPAFHAFDLNADDKIGFGDYAIELTKFGNGTGTPAPDPYTSAGVVQCSGEQAIVIDGKVIEDQNITIDAQNECSVTIRNSLIVSGSIAVKTKGTITLTVDNSIIVGEAGWLTSQGNVRLSAANSVFHGKQQSKGQVKYTDRGGNVFE